MDAEKSKTRLSNLATRSRLGVCCDLDAFRSRNAVGSMSILTKGRTTHQKKNKRSSQELHPMRYPTETSEISFYYIFLKHSTLL